MEEGRTLGPKFQGIKQAFVYALGAAIELGGRPKAEEILRSVEELPPGQRSPYLDAQMSRFRARLEQDSAGYEAAKSVFRELELPFWLGVTLLEQAELTGDGRRRRGPRDF